MGAQEIQGFHVGECVTGYAQHHRKIFFHGTEIRDAEEGPADHHDDQRVQMPYPSRPFLHVGMQHVFLDNQEHAVIGTPQHEVPAGTVPQSGEGPHNQQVQNMSRHRDPIAAQRNVHVLPEPGTQGNVPSSPELRDAVGDVRIVEVFAELKTEHPSQADGHVRISAEVEINLQCIGADSDPVSHHGNIAVRQRTDGGVQGAEIVGQQDFFAQAENKSLCAFPEIDPIRGADAELLLHISVLDNRTRNELREQGQVQGKAQKTLLRSHVLPVHVENIGQRLEGIKRDSDWQGQRRVMDVQSRQGVEGIHQESEVFKESQHQQVHEQGKEHGPFAGTSLFLSSANLQGAVVVQERAVDHQYDVHRFAPAVEQQAGRQQHQVPGFDIFSRHQVVNRQSRRKEIQ